MRIEKYMGKRGVAWILSLAMASALMAGCSGKSGTQENGVGTSEIRTTGTSQAEGVGESGGESQASQAEKTESALESQDNSRVPAKGTIMVTYVKGCVTECD